MKKGGKKTKGEEGAGRFVNLGRSGGASGGPMCGGETATHVSLGQANVRPVGGRRISYGKRTANNAAPFRSLRSPRAFTKIKIKTDFPQFLLIGPTRIFNSLSNFYPIPYRTWESKFTSETICPHP